jgi:beta-xylosidase
VPGSSQQPFLDPSDDFTAPDLGLQWGFWHEFDPNRFKTGAGVLTLEARGKTLAETSVLTTPVGGHSYTVEVDVEMEQDCVAGLLLFYNLEHSTGITLSPEGIGARLASGSTHSHLEKGATRATFRIVNDRQEIDFYYKLPGKPWRRTEESAEISGVDHNVLGGFLDVRPALCAYGTGRANFRAFHYWPEVKVPA